MKFPARLFPIASLLLATFAIGGTVYAQLEGADRGVPPIDSASTFEILGIEVDVSGKTSEEARYEGWRQAQLKGWKALWAKMNNKPITQAPTLPDSTLNAIVSGIIIEQEQIGPQRYVARLGLLFDRARAGQLLGVGPLAGRRSAPMLVIPVMITGSTPYSFEFRNEWQKAWARFRTGNSPVDYVRTSGSGIDPLLLNASQIARPGRGWWRMLLDQYGAADVIVPQVRLRRSYPGGPVLGEFAAFFGPDKRLLGRFALRAGSSASLPRLMDEGVRRLDALYTQALAFGVLTPDPTLIIEEPEILTDAVEEIEAASAAGATVATRPVEAAQAPTGMAAPISIRVGTPDEAAIQQAEVSVSRVPGVTSAFTTSRAAGGTSVVRVTFTGDIAALASALQAQGWTVEVSGNSLNISRPAAAAPSGE